MNFYKYSGALLILACLAGPYPSQAEQTKVVGEQVPNNYQPIVQKGRAVIPDLVLSSQADPLILQNQMLQSAARVHQMTVVLPEGGQLGSIIPVTTLIGPGLRSLPVGRRAPSGTAISEGFPAPLLAQPSGRTSSVSPSAPAASSNSPTAANFNFLSLLKALPFVQKTADAVAEATMLGGVLGLGIFQGLLGSLGPLESVGETFGWMFNDFNQGNLPQVMTYQTASGKTIPIDDTFEPTATGQVFSPADLTSLTQFLDIVPPAFLQNIAGIVNAPVIAMTGGKFGSYTMGTAAGAVITIDGGTEINDGSLAHEVGLNYFISPQFQNGPLAQQWGSLWSQSTDPQWDTADAFSNFPPRPMPANQPIPDYGDINEFEDFASVFNDWMNESAAPPIYLNSDKPRSTSIIEQAVYAATQGHTVLLQKVLLMAALFTDQATQQLSLYNWQNYQVGTPIVRTQAQVLASSTSLQLGNYLFTVNSNGQLTGCSTIAATTVTLAGGSVVTIPPIPFAGFPTSVSIPTYAAGIWGIR